MGLADKGCLYTHFLITELRAFILLYVAYRSFVSHSILYDVMHSELLTTDFESSHRNTTTGLLDLGDYMDCAREEVEMAIVDPNAAERLKCIPLRSDIHMINYSLNVTAAAMCVVAMITLVLLLCCSGVQSMGHGKYIMFTYQLKKSSAYRAMALLQCLAVTLVVARKVYGLYFEFMAGKRHKVIEYAEDYGSEMLILIYSCVSLFQSREITFDVFRPDFQDLHFKRGFGAVFSERNVDFCLALEIALYRAGNQDDKDLSDMMPEGVSLEELMYICRPKSAGSAEYDDDNDDEEDPKKARMISAPASNSASDSEDDRGGCHC
uniref:Uncharacterized protein n=1 Tax=Zooxanthella nutricula TaxID=1333877 RepID=A0A7S2HLU3_9DINO